MTNLLLEPSQLEHLDFEASCDNCDRVAEWVLRRSCCDRIFLYCKRCKTRADRTIYFLGSVGDCLACGEIKIRVWFERLKK